MKLISAKDYPKFIYVNDEKYEVRLVKRVPGGPNTDCGLCDSEIKVIWIRKTQSPAGLFHTFVHEVLHALEAEYSIDIKHRTIYELEVAIASFVTDNF